jgi:predicted outer membrane repeat protein
MDYYKKISVFLMAIMVISMISGAYAANTTPDDNTNNVESNIIYVSPAGNDNWNGHAALKETKTLNGPKKTIKAALEEIDPDGIVKLAPGTYHENNIKINKYVTIEGCGSNNTVIDGKRGQVFYVNSSSQRESNVIFKDLSIENAKARFSGSAIYNNGIYEVFVKNCKFYDDSGSPIDNNGGCLTIENCDFDNNYNGAISNYGKMEIIDSAFNNNSADNGGAISNGDSLSISNCTFNNNEVSASPDSYDYDASFDGGAIYNNGALDVKNSIFNSNHADVSGGAIYNTNCLYVENCKFISNTAGYGGAISTLGYYLHSDHLIIDNNEFIKNKAFMDGGAIYKTIGGQLGTNKFKNNNPNNIKTIAEEDFI